MKIEITKSASDDIAAGFRFYEGRETGVGHYFESSIMSDIRSLLIYPGIHEIHFDTYHRMVTNHFPYAIFYKVENGVIRIYAVLNTRRNPIWISERLN